MYPPLASKTCHVAAYDIPPLPGHKNSHKGKAKDHDGSANNNSDNFEFLITKIGVVQLHYENNDGNRDGK